MSDPKTLLHRLRRKTVAGRPVFPSPIEIEAADRIEALESALQLIGNELDLHAEQGPAGEAFRALLFPTLEPTGS